MKTINFSWTAKLPEGVGAQSRLAAIIEDATENQRVADDLAKQAKDCRAAAVKAARRAERMIAELWTPEEIEAAKAAAKPAAEKPGTGEIPSFLRRGVAAQG